MFCVLLFNFVNYVILLLVYVFLLVCMFCSVYSVFTCQLALFGYPDCFSVRFLSYKANARV